eukprot:164459-Prymnesium_polylepis.1
MRARMNPFDNVEDLLARSERLGQLHLRLLRHRYGQEGHRHDNHRAVGVGAVERARPAPAERLDGRLGREVDEGGRRARQQQRRQAARAAVERAVRRHVAPRVKGADVAFDGGAVVAAGGRTEGDRAALLLRGEDEPGEERGDRLLQHEAVHDDGACRAGDAPLEDSDRLRLLELRVVAVARDVLQAERGDRLDGGEHLGRLAAGGRVGHHHPGHDADVVVHHVPKRPEHERSERERDEAHVPRDGHSDDDGGHEADAQLDHRPCCRAQALVNRDHRLARHRREPLG